METEIAMCLRAQPQPVAALKTAQDLKLHVLSPIAPHRVRLLPPDLLIFF